MSYTFQVLNDQFLNYNLYIEEDEQKALQNQEVFFFTIQITAPYSCTLTVSYTHLDVYKRQE